MPSQEHFLHRHQEVWLLCQNRREISQVLQESRQKNAPKSVISPRQSRTRKPKSKIQKHIKIEKSLQNHYPCASSQVDMPVFVLQPSGFQAQRYSVSSFHNQDATLPLVSPFLKPHRSLWIVRPVSNRDQIIKGQIATALIGMVTLNINVLSASSASLIHWLCKAYAEEVQCWSLSNDYLKYLHKICWLLK